MKALPACTLLLAGLLPRDGSGADALLLAGAEYRRDAEHYAYVGALVPFPGDNTLERGWIQRYWVDGNRYAYDVSDAARFGNAVQRIGARARGAEVAAGYRFGGSGWSAGGYAGVRYSDVDLVPDDRGARVRGNNVWPRFQLEWDLALAPAWHSRNIVSYTFGLQGYWWRSRLMRSSAGAVEWGPEIIGQGDRDYRAFKAGIALTGLNLGDRLSAGLRAGYHIQEGADSPYLGAELSFGF